MSKTQKLIKLCNEVAFLNSIKESMQSGYGVTGSFYIEAADAEHSEINQLKSRIDKMASETLAIAKRGLAAKVIILVNEELERLSACFEIKGFEELKESKEVELAIEALSHMSKHSECRYLFGSGASSTTIAKKAHSFLGLEKDGQVYTIPKNKRFWSKCLSIAVDRGLVKRLR